MELRQLRYFVSVAETNSFSEASRLLNITQSTLSQQVKQLENELGVMLFERSSHRVCLTDVGEAFLPEARRTLHAADVCIDRMNDIRGLKAGCLNIGSTFSFIPLLKDTVLLFMFLLPGRPSWSLPLSIRHMSSRQWARHQRILRLCARP